MTLKLLFDSTTGVVLGAQGVGGAGVDKRIDILAVAIQARMTVFDLEEMELSYSPQYGSAKDPVNMAGFVASGLLRGEHPQIDIDELLASPQLIRHFYWMFELKKNSLLDTFPEPSIFRLMI
jgi:hypothetical protein